MLNPSIGFARLHNQQISAPAASSPAAVVARLGALQAQDYLGALWAIGLRLAPAASATEEVVEAAVGDRSIVRTWPLRGTLHFVAAADVRWILDLLGPRAIAQSEGRRRQLGVSDTVIAASRRLIANALDGGRVLTRAELFARLQAGGISTEGQRGIYILSTLAQNGFLCFAARRGKQFTFALLEEWVPAARRLPRDEALPELALRYFTGHGPATLKDFARWAGLTITDARSGVNEVQSRLEGEKIDGDDYWSSPERVDTASPSEEERAAAYLLPGFDEFLLGYASRAAVVSPEDERRIHPGANGMFSGTVVSRGRVIGTWKRALRTKSVEIVVDPFVEIGAADRESIVQAADSYARYVGRAVDLVWSQG